MEATPAGRVDQLWTKGIYFSHPQPLLVKVKTAGQSCDFNGSCAEIPDSPGCVFVMRHILLTKGPLQAHSGVIVSVCATKETLLPGELETSGRRAYR